jgi:putative nucleotidyltransferase with HDIG domain
VEILELADFFDQRLQFLPYERMVPEQILDELHWMAREGLYRSATVGALAGLARVHKEELLEKVNRLPVFPAVALRALELAFQPDSSLWQIERLVSCDQVLAGQIIKVANSSLYSTASRISTIRQSLAHLGLEASYRVLITTVFQPLFASANLHGLWRHSLEISQLAERLAAHSGRTPAAEAFLAGLVHDVGRLALQRCSREDVIAYTRLLERGCEPVFAEAVLCGFDHGAGGADVLRLWSFPEHLIAAVQNHHEPEHTDSELAAILYLAEFWSGSDEDLPSWARLRSALERSGIPFRVLCSLPSPRAGWLESVNWTGPQAGAWSPPAEGYGP